jgi:hypothetical protein
VWELSVIDDCNTDGEVGNKECERLSGVVCNPTSTAIAVQYVLLFNQHYYGDQIRALDE